MRPKISLWEILSLRNLARACGTKIIVAVFFSSYFRSNSSLSMVHHYRSFTSDQNRRYCGNAHFLEVRSHHVHGFTVPHPLRRATLPATATEKVTLW